MSLHLRTWGALVLDVVDHAERVSTTPRDKRDARVAELQSALVRLRQFESKASASGIELPMRDGFDGVARAIAAATAPAPKENFMRIFQLGTKESNDH